ncbi:MAG: AAA family ATPase [Thermoclostridium sp.]|nr:AAA family ATPase [Thermoclostridium sp.]
MAFVPTFTDAERIQCKASIMIEGLTGSGKTGLALAFGKVLAGGSWQRVFHIDTENKSANLFVGIPFSTGGQVGKFKVGQLTADIGYKPENYLIYRDVAKKAGAEVVIEDSISHAWMYKGGVLDLVNEATKRQPNNKNDKYAAWRDEEVAKQKQLLLELIRDPEVHVITTVRVKEKFDYDEVDGKKKLVSLGEQQIQQDDLKYEPDLVLHMISPGYGNDTHPVAEVIKTRYPMLKKGEQYSFTPELMLQVKAYLEEGADPLELLEQQRKDYIEAAKNYLDTHPTAQPIWQVLKKDAGHEETKLTDLPLAVLKNLYIRLTN